MSKFVVYFIADTHNGSTMGLMTKAQWQGDNWYDPNPVQKIIRKQLEEGLDNVKALKKKGYKLILVMAGDAIDGDHHNTTELITKDVEEQKNIHRACMLDIMKYLGFNRKTDVLYYVEGTEAHTGTAEGSLAKDLGAKPYRIGTVGNDYQDGKYVWSRLTLNLNGVRFDIAHHGGKVGKRAWGKENTLISVLKSIYFDSLNHNAKPVDYWIRANEHRHITGMYQDIQGKIEGIVLPALQFTTRYGQSVSGDISYSTIGTVHVVVEEDGSSWWQGDTLEIDQAGKEEVYE